MKKLFILLILITQIKLTAQADYYNKSSNMYHGALPYDQFVLGAPSLENYSPDFLKPRIIHTSEKIKNNSSTNAYEEGTAETRKIIIRDNRMEIK